MSNFCGKCGSPLRGGRCPNCDAPAPAYGGAQYARMSPAASSVLSTDDPFILVSAGGMVLLTVSELMYFIGNVSTRSSGQLFRIADWFELFACLAISVALVRTFRAKKSAMASLKTLGCGLFAINGLGIFLCIVTQYRYYSYISLIFPALSALLMAETRREGRSYVFWLSLAGLALCVFNMLFSGFPIAWGWVPNVCAIYSTALLAYLILFYK